MFRRWRLSLEYEARDLIIVSFSMADAGCDQVPSHLGWGDSMRPLPQYDAIEDAPKFSNLPFLTRGCMNGA